MGGGGRATEAGAGGGGGGGEGVVAGGAATDCFTNALCCEMQVVPSPHRHAPRGHSRPLGCMPKRRPHHRWAGVPSWCAPPPTHTLVATR